MLAIAAVTAAIALAILVTGGWDVSIDGRRVSMHNAARPFLVAGIAWLVYLFLSDRSDVGDRAAGRAGVAAGVAALLACAALAIGLRFGAFLPLASDSYGYVSQAELIANGRLTTPVSPLAAAAPWPEAAWTFAPLGYRPGSTGALVPTYPPGYPALMAAAIRTAGTRAGYVVVPLMGALLVWATWRIGMRVVRPATGLFAALVMLCSPILLIQLCVPMSDVPAAALWALALSLTLAGTHSSVLAAGVVSGLALAVRPNLLLLAVVLAVAIAAGAWPRGRAKASIMMVGLYALGMLPGLVAVGWLFSRWYGSPFKSGYGELGALFSAGHAWANLARYPAWMVETHSILAAAPLLLLVRRPVGVRIAPLVTLAAFAAGTFASYLFYLPFDNWGFLRFLLPAWPSLMVLAVAGVQGVLERFRIRHAFAIVLVLVGTVALRNLREAQVKGVFTNHSSVERFRILPERLRDELPPDAVFVTRVYSGSILYVAKRPILRWDVLDAAWIDRALAHLRGAGLQPYVVLEAPEEERLFREKFSGSEAVRRLDAPVLTYRGVETVNVYAP
jgi:hypothetical protein